MIRNENDRAYEIVKHGYFFSNTMKKDIVDLFFKSQEQKEYINPSDYVRLNLEEKYGRCWSIIIMPLHVANFISFPRADDCLFQFNTKKHQIITYMVAIPVPLQLQNTIVHNGVINENDYPKQDERQYYFEEPNQYNYGGLNRQYWNQFQQ